MKIKEASYQTSLRIPASLYHKLEKLLEKQTLQSIIVEALREYLSKN